MNEPDYGAGIEHEKARRLARLIVSEIGLYNPWWDPKGKGMRSVASRLVGVRSEALQRLGWEIEQGRRYYNERIPSGVRRTSDYYQEAVVSILGGGNPNTLKRVLKASNKGGSAGSRTPVKKLVRKTHRRSEKPLDRDDLWTRYNLGIAYREMGLLEEAIAQFELAAADETLLFACASMLGLCHLDQSKPKEAVEWLERGLHVPGRAEEEYYGLRYDFARALEASGELEKALAILRELYEHRGRPTGPPTSRSAAESSASDQARWCALLPEWIGKIEAVFPWVEDALAVSQRNEILNTLERSKRALAEYRPDEFRVCVLRLQRAERVLEGANREDLETRYNLGIAYKEMGLIEEAIAEFELAASDESLFFACASMLGRCLLEQGRPKEAVAWLERGLLIRGRAEADYEALRNDLARALEALRERE